MGWKAREWICLALFRLVLPLSLLAATIVRFNGFSLMYGCLALLSPLVRRPTHQTISQNTGTFLVTSVVICSLTLLAQSTFQIFVVIQDKKHDGFLQNCTKLESILRQIGLQRIDPSDPVNIIRIILPDICSFIVSLLVLVICRSLLKSSQRPPSLTASTSVNDTGSVQIQGRLFKFGVLLSEFLGGAIVILLMAMCGIATPSILNSVYFVCFLVVITMLACGVHLKSWFTKLEIILLVYNALHLLALYLSQFPFVEDLWIQTQGVNSTLERILGLKRFVHVDCAAPWYLHIIDDVRWPDYVNVGVLIGFFFIAGIEARRRFEKPFLLTIAPVPHSVEVGGVEDCDLQNVSAPGTENKSLISDTTGVRNYHSMDPTIEDDGANVEGRGSAPPSVDGSSPEHNTRFEAFRNFVMTLVAFATRHSYVATLIIMMTWSITYHSWLAFTFLITACLIWMVPRKRQLCLRCSPVIVFYAECLIIIQYIYGFNLTDEELPVQSNGGYNFKEIGLVKVKNPICTLAVMIAYTCVFWMTLRQFVWELVSEQRSLNRTEASSLDTLNGGHSVRRSAGNFLMSVLNKYWIIVCSALFLLMALQEPVVYRIIYMILFLYFISTFQLNYSFWRCCVRVFWPVVIIYSMVVLVAIYVVQFEDIMERMHNSTGISYSLLKDIGFERYDTKNLFVHLLTPTSFLIFIILHLHYFQRKFLEISDINRYARTGDLFNDTNESGMDRNKDEVEFLEKDETSWAEYVLQYWRVAKFHFNNLSILIWRLLEVHVSKLVMLTIFLICVNEVSVINVLLVVLLVILMLFGLGQLLSLFTMVYASLVIIAKMVYQLNLVTEQIFATNCTHMRNMNSSTIPYPFNGTINNAPYLGFEKTANIYIYVKDYVLLVLLLAFESIVIVHQRQYYTCPDHHRPKSGIVFPNINRQQADAGLVQCIKFLVNYGFYKFGKEICFVMTVVTMVVRLDVFSIVYGLLLGILVLLDRRICRILWPFYVVLLAVFLIIQYLSCVGAPLSICWEYPWNLSYLKNQFPYNLKVFLYLPDYIKPPHSSKLIADFFQLLFACLQMKVFVEESKPTVENEGGSNKSIASDVISNKLNPYEDFVLFRDSYLDYVKLGVFYYSFWLTLLILFITGTMRISLFCLGYLIACFFFLWFGQDVLLYPLKRLQKIWSFVLMYCYFVLMVKCALQIVGCVYHTDLCWVEKLFSITCITLNNYYEPAIISITPESCSRIKEDQAGLAWDAASFAFILFLIRVFKSWYFQHVVTKLKVDNEFSSRGSELINQFVIDRMNVRKNFEAGVLNKIRNKVDIIRQKMDSQKTQRVLTDHYEVIRSGDYHMFEVEEDEESVQVDEMLGDKSQEITKVPTPSEILNKASMDGIKSALDYWDNLNQQLADEIATATTTPVSNAIATASVAAAGPAVPSAAGDQVFGSGDLHEFSLGEDGRDIHIVNDAIDMEYREVESDDCDDCEQIENEANCCSKLKLYCKFFVVLLCSSIEQIILILDNISQDYIEISNTLEEEKQRKLAKINRVKPERDSPLISIDENAAPQPSRNASDDRILDDSMMLHKRAEKQFHRRMPLLLRLVKSALWVMLSHSELLCYFAMVLNVMVYGSVPSLLYPMAAFLWAMLSTPHPAKVFWLFVITYTQILIIIKYIFQFFNLHSSLDPQVNVVFYPPYVFGVERTEFYAAFDIFLLFCLFLHRSVLKQHGLWKDAEAAREDFEEAEISSKNASRLTSVADPEGGLDGNQDGDANAAVLDEIVTVDDPLEPDSAHIVTADEVRVELEQKEAEQDEEFKCCDSVLKPFKKYYKNLTDEKFKAATDVYLFIFFCDLITFIIVIAGFSSFGPNDTMTAGTTVTSVLKKNKIPASFLGMLLVQFIFVIIDRAIYLRKQILVKLIFQIFLVFLVHAWMFFGLPHITQVRFVDNVAAQFWYFTKCIYFALSSYQIRSGYPTCILGNFLTKQYNYLNLYCFQGFLAIPFLLELRALMDWMFTDTSLALSSWLQMEDIYANIFVIKCNRRAEAAYPTPRGKKRAALVKYGLGGVILFLLIFIIWFPLLLFSLSGAIFLSDPPIEIAVNIKINGYEQLFTTSSQDLRSFTKPDFDQLYQSTSSVGAKTFMNSYQLEDIYNCKIVGTSGALWAISPPSLKDLVHSLNNDSSVNLIFSVTFKRNPNLSPDAITGQFVRLLNNSIQDREIRQNLTDMIREDTNKTVVINNAFPRYVNVPSVGKVSSTDYYFQPKNSQQSELYGKIQLKLEKQDGMQWWSVQEVKDDDQTDDIHITTFNDRIAPSGVLSLLNNYGVIGLYVSLVLVIGKFVRIYIQGLSYKIMFVELPDPNPLYTLCQDIYTVRESGELSLEEELFAQLIFLYRSPETMIKVTKKKEKLD